MQITFSQLKKLPVYTQSGIYLGKVVDAVLEVDSNLVFQYKVQSHKVVGRTFLINVSQVRSITTEKIIVDDASVPSTGVVSAAGCV